MTYEKRRNHRAIGLWLLVCCCFVFGMVLLGGYTRLTRSGLSMTDWKPIRGMLPPMSHQAWEKEFNRYKQFPEYKKLNKGMSLAAFKSIYWPEYLHRLLGRLIGMIFFFPFLFFLIRKKIDKRLIPRLLLMFVLGGLQGLMGWYMVKSGLVKNPHVSQYRLAAHLSLAFLIFGFMLWVSLGLLFPREQQANTSTETQSDQSKGLRLFGFGVLTVVSVMVISGAFVAGLKAGRLYNTFPLMGNGLVPPGLFNLKPLTRNFFENVVTVQFTHRSIAYLLCILVPLLWWRVQRSEAPTHIRRTSHLMLGMLTIQVSLGIATLLYIVPVSLGVAHQGGALLLFTIMISLNQQLFQWHHAQRIA